MARGWESKAVEAQQAAADANRSPRPVLSEADQERQRDIEVAKLSLADATSQLQASCNPVHRDMLHRRIDALQHRLHELQGRPRA